MRSDRPDPAEAVLEHPGMRSVEIWRAACRAVARHPLQSLLIAIAVGLATASMVVSLGLGEGARLHVTEQIRALGGRVLIIVSGSARTGAIRLGLGTRYSLTEEDAAAIEREIPAAEWTAPSIKGNVTAVHGGTNWSTYLLGVTPAFTEARDWPLADGRPLAADDVVAGAGVALVGATVVQQLFPDGDPVGRQIRVQRAPLTVVGVLAPKGQDGSGQDWDDIVLVPITTAKRRIVGRGLVDARSVSAISVKVRPEADIAGAQSAIRDLLRQRHRLASSQGDDFHIVNVPTMLEVEDASARTFGRLIGAVAAISLVVGGLGIANVMLASVTDRTLEIGLRMAVGARPRQIMGQFAVEALLLSVPAALMGVGLGAASLRAAGEIVGLRAVFVPEVAGLACLCGAAVGLGAGLYPAWRAARIDPIVALGRN